MEKYLIEQIILSAGLFKDYGCADYESNFNNKIEQLRLLKGFKCIDETVDYLINNL